MKRLVVVLAACALAAAGAPAGGGGGAGPLQGQWRRTSPQAGARVPLVGSDPTTYGLLIIALNGTGTVTVRGDRLVAPLARGKVELNLTLDPGRSPKAIDGRNGKGAVVFRGIYETGKDTLRLCISPGDERPKRFENTPQTPLFEFKRQ